MSAEGKGEEKRQEDLRRYHHGGRIYCSGMIYEDGEPIEPIDELPTFFFHRRGCITMPVFTRSRAPRPDPDRRN